MFWPIFRLENQFKFLEAGGRHVGALSFLLTTIYQAIKICLVNTIKHTNTAFDISLALVSLSFYFWLLNFVAIFTFWPCVSIAHIWIHQPSSTLCASINWPPEYEYKHLIRFCLHYDICVYRCDRRFSLFYLPHFFLKRIFRCSSSVYFSSPQIRFAIFRIGWCNK